MIFRDEATGIRFELVEIDGQSYLLTEDGFAYPTKPISGGDFGISAILIAMIVVTLITAAASAYMQYQMGQQQRKAAEYNAQMMERQAEQQRQIGRARADDIRQRNRVMLGQMQAEYGASGVEAAPGTSPLMALAYSAREGELDALRAQWSGDANAEATTANARLQRFQGANYAYAGTMQAGSTLLSGAGSAARMYYGASPSPGGGQWGYL